MDTRRTPATFETFASFPTQLPTKHYVDVDELSAQQ